jgi:hypothetical protein
VLSWPALWSVLFFSIKKMKISTSKLKKIIEEELFYREFYGNSLKEQNEELPELSEDEQSEADKQNQYYGAPPGTSLDPNKLTGAALDTATERSNAGKSGAKSVTTTPPPQNPKPTSSSSKPLRRGQSQTVVGGGGTSPGDEGYRRIVTAVDEACPKPKQKKISLRRLKEIIAQEGKNWRKE